MQTVLVVDDDPQFLDGLTELLSGAGYEVLSAANGDQAIGLLEKMHTKIALTVIDLALPGTNGFEIIGAIARRPNPIKMIATTAVFKDSQLEVASVLGAHAVIRKPPAGQPLPEQEWLTTVRRLIGGPVRERRAGAAQASGTDSGSEPSHGNDAH